MKFDDNIIAENNNKNLEKCVDAIIKSFKRSIVQVKDDVDNLLVNDKLFKLSKIFDKEPVKKDFSHNGKVAVSLIYEYICDGKEEFNRLFFGVDKLKDASEANESKFGLLFNDSLSEITNNLNLKSEADNYISALIGSNNKEAVTNSSQVSSPANGDKNEETSLDDGKNTKTENDNKRNEETRSDDNAADNTGNNKNAEIVIHGSQVSSPANGDKNEETRSDDNAADNTGNNKNAEIVIHGSQVSSPANGDKNEETSLDDSKNTKTKDEEKAKKEAEKTSTEKQAKINNRTYALKHPSESPNITVKSKYNNDDAKDNNKENKVNESNDLILFKRAYLDIILEATDDGDKTSENDLKPNDYPIFLTFRILKINGADNTFNFNTIDEVTGKIYFSIGKVKNYVNIGNFTIKYAERKKTSVLKDLGESLMKKPEQGKFASTDAGPLWTLTKGLFSLAGNLKPRKAELILDFGDHSYNNDIDLSMIEGAENNDDFREETKKSKTQQHLNGRNIKKEIKNAIGNDYRVELVDNDDIYTVNIRKDDFNISFTGKME